MAHLVAVNRDNVILAGQNRQVGDQVVVSDAEHYLLESQGRYLPRYEGDTAMLTYVRDIPSEDAGPEGKSAFDLWLEDGNSGDLEDYFEAMRGEPGVDGAPTEQEWADMESRIGGIESDMSSMGGQVAAVESTVATIESDMSSMGGQVAAVESTVADLDSRVGALEAAPEG